MDRIPRGTQIKYTSYPGATPEFGFVTSGPSSPPGMAVHYFCRFWINNASGAPTQSLRTRANSELTPLAKIEIIDSVPVEWVNNALQRWC